MGASRIPIATYRLQFHAGFTFDQGRAIAPYLHRLGITDLYASPIFQARRGSMHGYDVTDPTRINQELGGESSFELLSQELQAQGMGLLLDIVPNHMAASLENPWWSDVLEHGPASPYAGYFDIDWDPPGSPLTHRLLLPVLGRPFGEALEAGELTLSLEESDDEATLGVSYYENRFPLEIKSYAVLLSHDFDALQRALIPDNPASGRLQQLIGAVEGLRQLLETIKQLPDFYTTDPGQAPSRHQTAQQVKQNLRRLLQASPPVRASLERVLAIYNGQPGQPASFDLLERLLAQQPYRLTFWQTGRELLNYRRFFDINDLTGLRVELPSVFEATHRLTRRLVNKGQVTSLRIDHIDGLRDPLNYLRSLQRYLSGDDRTDNQFYVVVEKILAADERLPEDWPVAGTTGYDFLNALNGVFVDRAGFRSIRESYNQLIGFKETSFQDVAYQKNREILSQLFPREAQALGQILDYMAEQDRHACDLLPQQLTQAVAEVTACLPVYRSYFRNGGISEQDQRFFQRAIADARARNLELAPQALDFLQRVVTGAWPDFLTAAQRQHWQDFVLRWQQLSGPAMAKGLEDTALYTYTPLLSLNTVGGEPTEVRLSTEAFHRYNTLRQSRWPNTLNATSTHDTKRSEDVLARINALSEEPSNWQRRLNRWMRWNRGLRITLNGQPTPDSNVEQFIYQSMLGAWPLDKAEAPEFQERLKAYLVKAGREAKTYTTWLAPDLEYEAAVASFIDAILRQTPDNRFLPDFLQFQRRLAFFGAFNSLSQVVLKVAAPGVPDFYQGAELWDFSLVDPDNRRPVDFARRERMLDALIEQEAAGLASLAKDALASWEDGRIKLYITYKTLHTRQRHAPVFQEGDYLPLTAQGAQADNVFAFARRLGQRWVIAATPRLLTRVTRLGRVPLGRRIWGDTALLLTRDAPRRWRNVFDQESLLVDSSVGLPLAQVFNLFPVAILVSDEPVD